MRHERARPGTLALCSLSALCACAGPASAPLDTTHQGAVARAVAGLRMIAPLPQGESHLPKGISPARALARWTAACRWQHDVHRHTVS
jgi:hypothetical protein